MPQANVTMEAQLQGAIAAGTRPQRYKTSVAQFIRAPGGRRIKLVGADSQPTAEGRYYYAQLGVDVPLLYAYEQPLLNDKWVMAFDGTRVKVRERNADGSWRITKNGEDYFRYNRNQYLPRVPFLIAKKLMQREGDGYDGTVVAGEYMPFDLATAGHVRAARV